ncbi:endolytic transglycosylase MltG [Thermomonas sp.]|uniref:endolytic transglycosylase MltG n=1 Tax=Thermomonas sp. TaxID=1971895 RepID=UPI002488763B|nr:endolytic transglycosylase MltG [Thermomonas sp.]MDI1253780.1 endolytic transglycosylase MltG [Thermomonas sp.]
MSRRSPRASGGALKRILWLLLIAAIVAGAWTWQRYQGFANAPLVGIEAGDHLLVARGDSLDSVLRKLQAEGVRTGELLQWKLLARKLGAAGKLQVGEYALEPGIDPEQLLLAMRDGKVVRRKFTIVEGWNIRDLRAALAKVELLEHASRDMDDAALMRALDHADQHPEGRFLPETYAWVRGDSDLDVLRRAWQAMDKALDAAWTSRADGLPLNSKDELLTLASIIEKETGIAEERPAIAGVFERRMKVGMRLQTDPTVIYGMGSAYAGNIRRSDLTTDTPYNTYTRDGLPPTPIAMPGAAALRAATHPADGDALYFVAVGDGSGHHVFTRSLAEHQVAVRDYLQRYRAQQQAVPK